MTDIIYDFISTGVDLILVGSVLSAMIIMLRGSTQLTTLISNQQVVTEEFDYYLQYYMYDNQKGLASADALSAMVGNRYDLVVWIESLDGKIYINVPDTGKYYEVDNTAGSIKLEDQTLASCKTLAESGTLKTYKELAATDVLSPENLFHANIIGLGSGKLETVNFSRDVIVVGLYFKEYTEPPAAP